MKYITLLPAIIGIFCWSLAYVLIIYRGIKDKTYGIPLIPLTLNLGWEFVYSFCFSFSLTNMLWFFCDLGIVYTYFKYGYNSFRTSYHLEKKQWCFLSVLVFVISFLLNFSGHKFFAQYLNQFPAAEIPVFTAWSTLPVTVIGMLVMFFQRGNSQGQSFLIVCILIVANIALTIPLFLHPFYYKWNNPFLILMIMISIGTEFYYAKLLYYQLRKEGLNPWKRL